MKVGAEPCTVVVPTPMNPPAPPAPHPSGMGEEEEEALARMVRAQGQADTAALRRREIGLSPLLRSEEQ